MKAFFSHTISAVRVNGELTYWFTVNTGTGQGDIQGPPVFNFCLNFSAYLMEQQKVISKGVTLLCESSRVEEKHILDTDYADDMALLDNTEEGLQETTDLLCKYSAYAGLKINAGKTKCMAVSKCASQKPYCRKDTLDISVEGLPIEQVSNFTYLGAIISADGTIDKNYHLGSKKRQAPFTNSAEYGTVVTLKHRQKLRFIKRLF